MREMFFYRFSILALTAICSAERHHFRNFGRGLFKKHFCEIILKSARWPWMRCRLTGFYIFSSDGHFAERNHFSNFGRGSTKEHFCDII